MFYFSAKFSTSLILSSSTRLHQLQHVGKFHLLDLKRIAGFQGPGRNSTRDVKWGFTASNSALVLHDSRAKSPPPPGQALVTLKVFSNLNNEGLWKGHRETGSALNFKNGNTPPESDFYLFNAGYV